MNEQEQPIAKAVITISERDFKACYWYWRRRESTGQLWFPGLFLLVALVSGVLGFVFENYGLGIIMPAWGLFLFVRRITEPGRKYRKYYAHDKTQTTYTFYEDHYYLADSGWGDDVEVRQQYSRYTCAEETKTAFYLNTRVDCVNLPKHCFTEKQITALRALFERKFGEKFKQYKQK